MRGAVAGRGTAVLAMMVLGATAQAAGVFAVGSDSGRVGELRVYDGTSLASPLAVTPYGAGFGGGVRVAVGDLNADGTPDLAVVPGAGNAPQTQLYDGAGGGSLGNFYATTPSFTGGVYVAAGDVDGDGRADIVVGLGAGAGPQVSVFSGRTHALLWSFFAYDAGFTGGVRVAAGDVNGDGRADVIVGPGSGSGPVVRVFDGVTHAKLDEFNAYAPSFLGGVYVASADLDGDGRAEIVTGADAGGAPVVSVFGLRHEPLASFLAFGAAFGGGVRVAAGDVDGDRVPDLVVATGAGAPAQVKVLGWPLLEAKQNFLPFGGGYTGGAYVAAPAPQDAIFLDGFDGG